MFSHHDLYPVGQTSPDAPDQIKDRNGVVVLQMCRRCGRVEAELSDHPECAPLMCPRTGLVCHDTRCDDVWCQREEHYP